MRIIAYLYSHNIPFPIVRFYCLRHCIFCNSRDLHCNFKFLVRYCRAEVATLTSARHIENPGGEQRRGPRGSLESNMPLVNAIQPFASRRLAWLYRGATAGSGADRILSVAADRRRWRWWQVGEVCGVLYPSLAIPHTVPQLMESPRLAFWRMLRELRPSHVSASSCVADSQRIESLPRFLSQKG